MGERSDAVFDGYGRAKRRRLRRLWASEATPSSTAMGERSDAVFDGYGRAKRRRLRRLWASEATPDGYGRAKRRRLRLLWLRATSATTAPSRRQLSVVPIDPLAALVALLGLDRERGDRTG